MKEFIFWKDWERPYKLCINFLLGLFILCLVFMIVGLVKGEDFVIHWQVLNIKEPLSVNFDSFSKGFFNFNIIADNFVVFQKFVGSELQVNLEASYLFGAILSVGLVFYLSVITDLSRFWYIVAMGIFIIFMVNLKLEHLLIFERIDRLPLIVIFIITLPVSYYFHAIRKETSFMVRVFSFAVLVAAFCVTLYFISGVPNPFLYIVNYGILGVLIITCVFILMISHEIISAFVYLLTNSTSQSKNTMQHFLVISVFYIGNVMLLYLYETKIIDWNFYYVNPYILLTISSVIGFWGLITRSEVFGNAIPFYPWAPILYLTIGIIAFGTTGYLFVTGNDPILEVIEDTIIYGHLGFGFIFFIYILSNFGGLIGKNYQVYKVLYKPKTMPYFTFRFVGLIAVVGMFLKENIEVPIYHSLSGYYNGIGDLYTANRDYLVAEQYYKLGSEYGYQNHRSNYALASLASKQGDFSSASYFYEQAINKRPTEYSYVNLSNNRIDNDQFLQGLFTLKDGLDVFPSSGPLMINAGLAFKRTAILDSAAFLFDQASNKRVSERLGKNNLLALVCENNWALDPDSLKNDYFLEGNDVASINYSVIQNQNKRAGNYEPEFPADSILGLISSSRIINHSMNSFMQGDETFLPVLDSLRKKPENYRYTDDMEYILALGYFKADRIDKSISILKSLAANDLLKSGLYNNTIGLIAVRHEAWQTAFDYFEKAYERQYPGSLLNRSIALSELGELEAARESWSILRRIDSKETAASFMFKVLHDTPESLDTLDDNLKYQFLLYRSQELSDDKIDETLSSFADPIYPESFIIYQGKKLINQMNYKKAYELLSKYAITSQGLMEEYRLLKLISQPQFKLSENDLSLINSNINGSFSSLKRYLRAMNAANTNDTVSAAREFEKLGFGNPFFIPGVIKASEFFARQKPTELTSYSLIVEAVQYNESSLMLWKKYVEECLRRGFDNYANYGLEAIKPLMSDGEYTAFMKQANEWKNSYKEPEFE